MDESKKKQEVEVLSLNDPYKDIKFVKRRATIKDKTGKIIFDEEVEFPDYFSDTSVTIVASKYLCNDAKAKEKSLKDMIDRVSNTISEWGKKDSYFSDDESVRDFNYKLKYYQAHQYFTFNSPVYFNVGLTDKPSGSACYILEIEDNMESIYDTIKQESIIFKSGAGSGINMSSIRSSKEKVRGGGFSSGPISFLKAADASAGVIRSGGTLRRSAKLVVLDDSHPDIIKFIHSKEKEEKKLRILKENNIEPEAGYELSDEVFFQNTNISVGLSDDFMKSVVVDGEWWTKYVMTGERCEKFKARDVLREISELAWKTADPGVQFSDNINKWNTCLDIGRIKSSNPCGEFLSLPNSVCNLAAINLRKFFYKQDDKILFDSEKYLDVIKTVITAQDIIIDNSSYPSRKTTNNTHNLRPLGIGYSNLGALLMWLGLPYDSDEGRTIAVLLTALLTGIAYETSLNIAKIKGPFDKFEDCKNSFYRVMKEHYKYEKELIEKDTILIFNKGVSKQIEEDVNIVWERLNRAVDNNEKFRNSQVTLLAPTGTTSFMMGCDTFGVEPDFSLIKYKTLSGNDGAVIKTINNTVEESLRNLNYTEFEIGGIIEELKSKGNLEKSCLNPNHIAIFDTASIPENGQRCIDYIAHVKMLESIQPFLSGAISKTINLPSTVTIDDIYNLYLEAWKKGLKGITVYREGSKINQPLRSKEDKAVVVKYPKCEECKPFRNKLPDNREASIHKFSISNIEGYITVGRYKSGKLGEVFLTVSKQGSTLSGLLDSLAIMISTCLQYGVPLKDIVYKLMFTRFEPSGITRNENIRFSTSIVDYVARYLGYSFLTDDEKLELGLINHIEKIEENKEIAIDTNKTMPIDDSAPFCDICGALMQRVGSCYNCNNCGTNSGACG